VSAGRVRLLAAALALLAVAAAVAAVRRPPGAAEVVVRDQRGREVASAPLPDSGRFALGYVHSVYRAPVTETFATGPGRGFRLVAIASPSQAVLDYYDLEGRRGSDGGGCAWSPRGRRGWRPCRCWPPRSAGAPWWSASGGWPCTPAAVRPFTWCSACAAAASRGTGPGSGPNR
jgi:hypothetical protein